MAEGFVTAGRRCVKREASRDDAACARPSNGKPVHLLAAADFDAAPIWGFDLRLAARPGADETWVRPFAVDHAPADSDEMFAAARLAPGTMRPRGGAVGFRFVNGRLVHTAVLLLSPSYCFLPIDGPHDLAYLRWCLGRSARSAIRSAARSRCRGDGSSAPRLLRYSFAAAS